MSHNHNQQHEVKCHCHDDGPVTIQENNGKEWKKYLPAIISFVLLVAGITLDHIGSITFFEGYLRLAWYIIAYIPVGFPVIKEAFEELKNKSFFNEFSLMTIATVGAFAIGEFPEGVAVMLFYSVGELFQDAAVNKAKRNIKALLDIRPDTASVLRNGVYQTISPEKVNIGETIQVKAGERVPLDGSLLSDSGNFNTSALTGESKPKTIRTDENVLAGMVNLDKVIEIKVEKKYEDSSLAKILEMVQNATARKAKTELLIRKFAKIYTPIVFFLALGIALIPYFFVDSYIFADWLYRALVFLVISCPCALVISIPLGYFGGIGAASHHGILFKGANYLDLMTKLNTVVMDKTGTLTEGVFNVQKVVTVGKDEKDFVAIVSALERSSNHPIAKAISAYANKDTHCEATNVEEIAGHGLKGMVNGQNVLAGNTKLMEKYGIAYDTNINSIVETTVVVAIENVYAGYIVIADKVKEDSALAVSEMHGLKIETVMLSGDKSSITQKIADEIGIDLAYGDLLPQDKVKHLEQLKANSENVVAFVGDGINDAPVLALSDIGIAMGGMGSDAAIETADVVIQTDQPSKIVTAIKISKATKRIVVQNIVMAFGVKIVVLILGAFGIATMWGAVFADVGVALLAILNAVRILRKKF
ncbi:cadmium-translocating P-type ATPase [Paludibacter sp. 221]|uniref:heavy metal translocating P-type ATPase n=1 Tax=Paludibacter sp. 221 TaxID=2302939 RepID=UPI0013D3D169|nr:heavy metal translocating P-type ATPase [Paludibacter sp. 221]NDV46828.1 cadmium-translocating P-type ATPase [Paludibacter sp. 221]